MLRPNPAIGACILALTSLQACGLVSDIVPTVPVHAATYYVATTGSDSNPGTEKSPWQTVAHAVDTMIAGDTTYVRGGTYREGTIRFRRSGTRTASIKLLNYPGEFPVIEFIDPTRFHRMILGHTSGPNTPIGWITIEGFELRNAYNGLKFHSAHDFTFRRNWIHGVTSQGIYGNGTRILIDRNMINDGGRLEGCENSPERCNKNHGMYMNGTGFTITNNVIYKNLTIGIQVNGTHRYDPAIHPGPEYKLTRDWVIANNTFAYQFYGPGIVVWGDVKNLRIENNIFYKNRVKPLTGTTNGISFVSADSSRDVMISKNLAYGGPFLNSRGIEGVNYVLSDNIVNVSDPAFVNAPTIPPASPDFALTERSPAIDAGLSLPMTDIAFDGTPRPQGRAYDIGAYEYIAPDHR